MTDKNKNILNIYTFNFGDSALTLEISNIKYCTITVFYNESENIFVQGLRFLNLFDENKIISTDTVILEHYNQIIELNLNQNFHNDKNIKYKYSCEKSSEIFPNSIEKNILSINNFLLKFEENNKFLNFSYRKIFQNYPQKIKYDESSYYCGTYINISNKKIAFGIIKIFYPNNKLSKYIVGYDSTILDLEDVKSIIKEILK
jgi:hypothetical protein